jgi:hypothetical protein
MVHITSHVHNRIPLAFLEEPGGGITEAAQYRELTKYCSLLCYAQTSTEAHLPSSQFISVGIYLHVKRSMRQSNHSPPYSAKVKHGGVTPQLPHTHLHGMILIN